MLKRFPTQLFVPIAIILLLVVSIATVRRPSHDPDGRSTVIYAHPPCPPDLMASFDEAFNDFRRQHPQIDLRVLHITGNYEDKVKVMFAGNVAPDVIFMYPDALPAWVDLNALQPLDELMALDGKVTRDSFFEAGISSFTVDGKLYGMPKDATADLVFYNKDMFVEKGIPLPTPDWTWDDYLAAAQKLTVDENSDGRIEVFGGTQPNWDRLVIQNGGRILSEDKKHCLLDTSEAKDAIQYWADLRTRYKVTPTPESTLDSSTWNLFATRILGMLISMYPCVPILRRTCDFEWDIALPPKGPVRAYSTYTGSALAIPRQCRNKEAAFTFARWMTTQGMRHVMSFDIPCYKSLGSSDEWRDAKLPPASKQVAIDVMAQAGPPAISHPNASEINDAIQPTLDRLNRRDTSVPAAAAAAEIVPKVQAILDRYALRAEAKAK